MTSNRRCVHTPILALEQERTPPTSWRCTHYVRASLLRTYLLKVEKTRHRCPTLFALRQVTTQRVGGLLARQQSCQHTRYRYSRVHSRVPSPQTQTSTSTSVSRKQDEEGDPCLTCLLLGAAVAAAACPPAVVRGSGVGETSAQPVGAAARPTASNDRPRTSSMTHHNPNPRGA